MGDGANQRRGSRHHGPHRDAQSQPGGFGSRGVLGGGAAAEPTDAAASQYPNTLGRDRSTAAKLRSGIQPDGTFEVRGILPGRYIFSAALTLPGWPTLRSISSPDGEVTDTPLNLESGDLTNLVITITDTPATSVEVRVQPVPKDDSDAVWVRVFSADRRLWQEPIAATRRFRVHACECEGKVTIGGLPPGEYLVATAAENTTGWMTREVLEKISGRRSDSGSPRARSSSWR